MLRGFSASLAAVFTYSQHVSAFTLPHLKHVTCSRYAPSCSGPRASASHCCSAGTLGFDRASIRPRPSWTSGGDSRASPDPLWNIFWNICTRFSLLPVHTGLLWHSSLPSATLRHLSSCCWLRSLFMGPGVPIPGCFSLFTRIWHVFHPPHPMISMPTSPPESQWPIHPWNQLTSDVTGFRNAQASRENRNHHFPRTAGIVHNSVEVLICGTSTMLMTSGYHAVTYNI